MKGACGDIACNVPNAHNDISMIQIYQNRL